MFQWLFDEAQMSADSVGAPVTRQQWEYIHEMGEALRTSLNNVTAVFAPSCIGHSVLTKRDWLAIKIDDISLAEALRCWDKSSSKSRGNKKLTKEQRMERKRLRMEKQFARQRKLSKEERELRKLKRQERRERRRKLHQKRRVAAIVDSESNNLDVVPMRKKRLMNKNLPKIIENENLNRRRHNKNCSNHHRHEQNHQRKRLHLHQNSNNINNMNQRASGLYNNHKKNNGNYNRNSNFNNKNNNNYNRNSNNKNKNRKEEPKKCTLRLLEQCSWPQCNQSCPVIKNPLTGEEMKLLELLASFGLDMGEVARVLGVNMTKLNTMEQEEFEGYFTQPTS